MRAIWIIAKRDLFSMFTSLKGYVVMTLLLLLFGVFFFFHLKGSSEASMRDMLASLKSASEACAERIEVRIKPMD